MQTTFIYYFIILRAEHAVYVVEVTQRRKSRNHCVARSGARPERTGAAGTFQERKRRAERSILLEALDRNDWHITRTAEELGLADHSSLLKIMRRHGLKR